MKQFWALLKTQLNVRFGISAMRYTYRHDKPKFARGVGLFAVVALGLGSLVGTYAFGVRSMFRALADTPALHNACMSLLLVIAPVIVMVTSVMTLLGVLFFSRDTELLASLPIPQRTVFAAKFAQVLLMEYLFVLALLLPPMACYPVMHGADYWLRCMLVLLAVPCVPLAIAAALSMLLIRFAALWRHRDLVLVVTSVVLLVGYFVGQSLLMRSVPQDAGPEFVIGLLMGRLSLVNKISAWYPPAQWATTAISEGAAGWLPLVLLLAVSACALIIVLAIAQRMYLRSALAMLAQARQHKPIARGALTARKPLSPAWAIFVREWRMILRTPTYALNSLIGVILAPLMLAMPALFVGSDEDTKALMELLHGQIPPQMLVLALAAVIGFIIGICPGAGTVLSREGRAVWISQVVPVSARRQVWGKALFALSISLLIALLGAVCLPFSLDIGFAQSVGIFALCALWSLHVSTVAVLFDIWRPKFDWENQTQIIKQSLNAVAGMLYAVLLMLALAAAMYLLHKLGVGLQALLVTAYVLLAALGVLSACALTFCADRAYANIKL